MQPSKIIPLKRGRAADWTPERLAQLGKHDVERLRENALRLGETELAELCAQVLQGLPKGAGKGNGPLKAVPKNLRLQPRTKAFEARGVRLTDPRTSWSGIAKDGTVVIALWASAVQTRNGQCACLLWAPNVDGSRPWADGPAGKERLEHSRLALSRGNATGLLVHGESLADRLPEDKARSIHGVDPQVVLALEVERDGDEYWAVWGRSATAPKKRAAASAATAATADTVKA
jgi:hypothetical protein